MLRGLDDGVEVGQVLVLAAFCGIVDQLDLLLQGWRRRTVEAAFFVLGRRITGRRGEGGGFCFDFSRAAEMQESSRSAEKEVEGGRSSLCACCAWVVDVGVVFIVQIEGSFCISVSER
jgi:hypothetical protein